MDGDAVAEEEFVFVVLVVLLVLLVLVDPSHPIPLGPMPMRFSSVVGFACHNEKVP